MIREQLSGVEYWEEGYPWDMGYFVVASFGERRFSVPYANGAIAPWNHFPTLAEVVSEVAALVEMLEGEEP